MMLHRVLARYVVSALAVAVASLVGCSLGEGITPSCDPAASPGRSNACSGLAECDDGNGNVKTTKTCCLPVGNLAYGKCDKHALTGDADFRTLCKSGGNACCNDAQKKFDECLQGSSTTTTSNSSSGSGGGGAGAGGGTGTGGGTAGTGG